MVRAFFINLRGMAQGENAGQNGWRNFKEWWSRRPYNHCTVPRKHGNKFMKRQVNKVERQQSKNYIHFTKLSPEDIESKRSRAWKYIFK